MKSQKFPKGFKAFIGTQMLGALNDNLFKMLLSLYFVSILGLSKELLFEASLCFTAPFLLFGPWSGYFADRFSKTRVLQIVKACEIFIMAMGVVALLLTNISLMLFVLFLMATQSAFFSPAKAGFIPETVGETQISHANGWMEMTTFFAIILGQSLAGLLLHLHHSSAIYVTYYCVGFAFLGILTSLFITPTRPSGAHPAFPKNPLSALWKDLKYLKGKRGLFLAGLGNSYFWLLGLIFQLNIVVYGKELLHLNEMHNSLLAAYLAVGIALGSILAARLSGKKVELGLVPLGGIGLSVLSVLLFFTSHSYFFSALVLFFLGVFGGLYIVPLYAFLQFEAGHQEKGKVLATVGIMNALFLVLGSFLYKWIAVDFNLSPKLLCLAMGAITLGVVGYICTVIPEYFIRFLAWLLTHSFYRIKIKGQENVPFHGPALLLVNHLSFIDAFLVGASVQRFIKFMMYKKFFDFPLIRFFCKIMEVIPIAPYEGHESVEKSLLQAKDKLRQGEVVCIFPEGGISRTGELMPFKKGFEKIMGGLDIPIIPVCLHNVWGSIFSFKDKKRFFKFPKKIPYPITVTYGKALPSDTSAEEAETIVREMLSVQTGGPPNSSTEE